MTLASDASIRLVARFFEAFSPDRGESTLAAFGRGWSHLPANRVCMRLVLNLAPRIIIAARQPRLFCRLLSVNRQTARYVVIYHPQFMNKKEWAAYSHCINASKAEGVRNNASLPEDVRCEVIDFYWEHMSTDPEVLALASGGWEAFLERAATRILRDHGPEIYMNRCPRCGEVTVTPRSKQCRYCRHDWHE